MRRIRKPVIEVPRTFEERLRSAAVPLATSIIDQLLGARRYDLVDRILKGMLEIYTPFLQQKRPSRTVDLVPLDPIAESNLPVEMDGSTGLKVGT